MTIAYDERPSDSPYVDRVMRGQMLEDGVTIRPAETCWHMVFVRRNKRVYHYVVGPWSNAAPLPYFAGAEPTWIRFRLGAFMPHLPTRRFANRETTLPDTANHGFWLHGETWELPTFENADTFADRLVRAGTLAFDPLVSAALSDHPLDVSPRTLRHRFLQTTGLTQGHIRQYERAMQAARYLQQGMSILDTVATAGYFDQPHLTRALKHFTGYTPAQHQRLHHESQPV